MMEANSTPQDHSLASCVFYSGGLTSTDVQARVERIEKTLVSFSRTQISVHNVVNLTEKESGCRLRQTKEEFDPPDTRACKLSNKSSFAANLAKVGAKFDRMYAKRAFVHWFVGIGIEDNTFDYVREDVRVIEQSYLDAGHLSDELVVETI